MTAASADQTKSVVHTDKSPAISRRLRIAAPLTVRRSGSCGRPGRALPEYRQLKEKYTFLQLVQTPELAAEVTLQPVRRFGFDAAILFSDILVIPEAMGQPYRFRETGGIEMDFKIQSAADIEKLSVEHVCEKLNYVAAALKILRKELGDQTALIGFSGSPWTLATFMMEGGSAEKFTKAKALFDSDKKTFFALMEKLTAAVTAYLQMQIAAGADALQIFDSHGGHLPAADFQEASGRWMREIIAGLRQRKFRSLCFRSARMTTGTTSPPPAQMLSALTGNFHWPRRGKFCRTTSASRAISIPRCSPR